MVGWSRAQELRIGQVGAGAGSGAGDAIRDAVVAGSKKLTEGQKQACGESEPGRRACKGLGWVDGWAGLV